jgi:hypothetical protein
MEKNHNGRWTEHEHEMFLQGTVLDIQVCKYTVKIGKRSSK